MDGENGGAKTSNPSRARGLAGCINENLEDRQPLPPVGYSSSPAHKKWLSLKA